MDNIKFQNAIENVKTKLRTSQIGTLQEKTLHAVLKYYIEDDITFHEQKIGPYYADILINHQIYEVQTKHFYKLRNKLEYFLKEYQVTIVYPYFYQKWLIWLDMDDGSQTKKRLSPKLGNRYNIFNELYQIKWLLKNPKLKFIILLMDLEEIRLLDGWSSDKKKGSHRYEQVPIKLQEEVQINELKDFQKLIPPTLNSKFTSKDFSKETKLSLKKAQIALNVLMELEIIERIGSLDKYYLYKVKDPYEKESNFNT